ncbi:MAG: glycosyltransferase [Acidimicrobiaceae bacterium]|nr:glycosyltransferase [Acidimicrobiaceae bacterium]
MRIAVWTPLPPQRSGVADYAYELLEALARRAEVTAVVRDGAEASARAPEGVKVVPKSGYRGSDSELDIYHFGNHARFHGYMYEPVLRRPGLLVLHDPALPDFHWDLCGGFASTLFAEESRFDRGPEAPMSPICFSDGKVYRDWWRLPLARRVVESSRLTVVHSEAARAHLSNRYPTAEVVHTHLAAPVLAPNEHPRRDSSGAVFGVFGGISAPKRLSQVLRAFSRVHNQDPWVRMVIAGRSDQPELVDELHQMVALLGLADAVSIEHDVSESELRQRILETDAVVALRWPTVGEMSAPIMRALGAGRLVICSDVPQMRGLSERFCWRVTTDDRHEVDELVDRMRAVAQDVQSARSAGAAAQAFVKAEASFAVVADQQLVLCDRLVRTKAKAHRPSRTHSEARHAVNAVGSWTSVSGVAEAARRMVGALLDVGVSVSLETVDFGYVSDDRRLSERLRTLARGRPYPMDLCFLNINEMNVLSRHYFRPRWQDAYVFANWYWELPTFPAHIKKEISRVDEIWAPSAFTANAFRGVTSAPIVVMPCVVEPVPDRSVARKDFGLPDDRFLILFGFDARSTFARKNPFAVIEAYRRAFSPRERRDDVALMLKTSGLRDFPEGEYEIRQRLATVGGLVIDRELTGGQMASLTAHCDAYISLHRTEGFGLGMAEAMSLGRPVVATAYSGNLDFMTSSNSCLVDCTMTTVREADLRFNPAARSVYAPGACWAEPDVDQAAHYLRMLYDDARLRGRLGAAAARTIRERYSAHAAGEAMCERLAAVELSIAS